MRKSLTKRVKITKSGQIIRRPTGVNHFRTKKTPGGVRKTRKMVGLGYPTKKILGY